VQITILTPFPGEEDERGRSCGAGSAGSRRGSTARRKRRRGASRSSRVCNGDRTLARGVRR